MNGLDLRALFSLDGKIALVTGGSRGIGYMISQGLLQAGARVYITARDADACRGAAGELGRIGPCEAMPIDISDAGARRELAEILSGREGKLDILVNNAGTSWGDRYEDYAAEAFDKVFRLNVASLFAMTRDFTPLLERAASKEEPSRVINIGSIDGLHVPTVHRLGTYAYAASKAAVHHLTRQLAVELGPRRRGGGHRRHRDLPVLARRRLHAWRGHSRGRRHRHQSPACEDRGHRPGRLGDNDPVPVPVHGPGRLTPTATSSGPRSGDRLPLPTCSARTRRARPRRRFRFLPLWPA